MLLLCQTRTGSGGGGRKRGSRGLDASPMPNQNRFWGWGQKKGIARVRCLKTGNGKQHWFGAGGFNFAFFKMNSNFMNFR